MHHKHVALVLVAALGLVTTITAAPVGRDRAAEVAAAFVPSDHAVAEVLPYPSPDAPLFFVARLDPVGFVVVAADDDLPAVIGYGLDAPTAVDSAAENAVLSLLTADLRTRLAQVPRLPRERLTARHLEWQRLLAGGEPLAARAGEIWPSPGTTPTGGWVTTRWSQGSPYNGQCPMDPVTHARSVAGCPAIAMAQIVNAHRNHHRTAFDDGDDYHHSYDGRSYWIDDDHAGLGFPSFPDLTAELATLEQHYAAGSPATDADAAALVFACGVAAHQVYTSGVSGTFGVDQALQAYLRFGEEGATLLGPTDPTIYDRLAADMQRARPAHLAVVDPAWQTGHNVVVDGYDSNDGRFHLNFGWGGAYDGWYLLPDEIPYGLTVIEGVVVDLAFALARDGFESGDLAGWSAALP